MRSTLARIRRYPVKSMGGEDLHAVEVDARGIAGDRWFAVRDGDGLLASGKNSRRFRRLDEVFEYAAHTTEGGVHVTHENGSTWRVGDPELDTHLSAHMGRAVSVVPEGAVSHQDGGAVSLVGTATLKWCADRWGIDADPRRLRVSLVVETTEPFVEETWVDREIAIGTAVLRAVELVPRCRMVDIDQDGAVAAGRWLKPLTEERGRNLSVYADVVRPGHIEVGDHLDVR